MENTEHLYLRFVRFKALDNWSVSHILGMNMGFTDMYPMIPIGQIIDRCTKLVTVENEIQYKQITLKTNGGGAVLRDVKLGKDIGTKKQYVVSSGQFIMSKIDARNGAFGVVSDELDGAIVTTDFPVFNVNQDKIIPQYLFLLSSTKAFARFAQSCSRGTTNRQRIDIALFLSQRIPLPSLTEQKIIVSNYNAKIQQAEDLEKKSIQIEKDIDTYLLESLGISQNEEIKNKEKNLFKFLKFIQFREINRWDKYDESPIAFSGLYDNITLSGVVVSKPQYGAAFRAKIYDGKIRYIRITDINDDGSLNDNIVSADGFSEQYRLKENDFLIARSGNTVGKSFLYKKEFGESIFAGYLIRFRLDLNKILPEYLLAYTKCSTYKKWVTDNMRVAAQPNINSSQYLNSPIILPPLSIQRTIVNHINEQKSQIQQLKQQAEVLRKKALVDFEKEIFKS